MKISIQQPDLLPAVQSVARSCGIRSTLPVLANILLSAKENSLTLSATNLEVGVVKQIPAQVDDAGEVTIPSRAFLDIISSLPSGEIRLESSRDQIKIITPQFNATLNGIPGSEFPSIPLSGDDTISVDGELVSEVLPEISFAAATDEGRPILTGILTQIHGGKLELVATDGFRLSHKTAPLKQADHQGFKALVPKRTFEEVVRLIGEEKKADKIELSTSENKNQLIFKVNHTYLSSRLIEGQYPSWERIIPTSFQMNILVNRMSLVKAIKLASVFAKDNANILKVETRDNQLIITSEAKELGSQETSVECETKGEHLSIAFNGKYLVDALSACPGEIVRFNLSGTLSPTLIKPQDEAEGLEYVVMPVRLN